MTAAHVGEKVCHPVVVVKVNGVKYPALLDNREFKIRRLRTTTTVKHEHLYPMELSCD